MIQYSYGFCNEVQKIVFRKTYNIKIITFAKVRKPRFPNQEPILLILKINLLYKHNNFKNSSTRGNKR